MVAVESVLDGIRVTFDPVVSFLASSDVIRGATVGVVDGEAMVARVAVPV
jgi:hypothetical protein